MDEDKVLKLKAFLEQLPESMARQLLTAVELDRVAGGAGLPHDVLLDGLRPHAVCAEDQVRRTPTPMRLFCDPFEDLLIPVRNGAKQPGLIARESLMPIWDWLAGDLMPALHREQCENLTNAILQSDQEKIGSVATELQTAGASAIARALEGADDGSAKRAELVAQLGSEDILADAVDMAHVLQIAPVINKVRKVMHKPVPRVSKELAHFLRKAVGAVPESSLQSLPYLFVVAMRRLERPWEILQTRAAVADRGEDLLEIGAKFAIVVELLFSELEAKVATLTALDPQSFDPETTVSNLSDVGRLIHGLSGEMESLRDAIVNDRLNTARESVGETLQMIFERIPKQIRHAMPFQAAGSYAARTTKRPDLTRKPNEKTMERARQLGIFMRDSRPASGIADVGNHHAEAYDQILEGLNAYREGLLSEMRSIESGDVIHNARAYLDMSVELTAILVSEGEAHILRRKAAQVRRSDQAANF